LAELEDPEFSLMRSAIGRAVIVDFHESESARLAGEAVAHHVHAVDSYTSLRKEIRYIGFGCRIGEVSYK
jgi:hypothetical protein